MNKLLKNPLLLFIFGAIATSLIGYLINQLPAIPDFRHKNSLIISAVIIVTLLIAWGTYQQSQQQPEDAPEQIDPTLRLRLLEAEETKVKKRLQDSLLLSLMIELDKQEQPEKVGRNPLQPLYTISANQNTSLPQQINRMVEVLQRKDIGGKLLILGQPGGGKTTTLLNLAEELLEIAKRDDTAPMPFIFELSAWRDDSVDILDWLIIQLKEEYNLTPGISRFWLERGDILPLLDGLDELGLERQKKCIKAINQYLGEDAKRDLVVCCREEEYHTGKKQLTELHRGC
jgi:predicted NACHT family NTPase